MRNINLAFSRMFTVAPGGKIAAGATEAAVMFNLHALCSARQTVMAGFRLHR